MPLIIGLVIIVIVGIVFYIFLQKNKARDLNTILNLELKLKNESVNIGQDLKYSIICKPSVRINADTIEGELISKRFDSYNNNWSREAFLSHGVETNHFVFSFGKDIIIVPGSDNRFDGYVPIPPDADPTEDSAVFHSHWLMTVRIHAKGYKSASVSREVIVTALNPQMLEVKKREEPQNVEFVKGIGKRNRKPNIQVLFPGSSNSSNENKSSVRNESSFDFLELENDQS